jgi:methyl-accepting chemotaxis protein
MHWLSHSRISTRILLSFAVVLALAGAVGAMYLPANALGAFSVVVVLSVAVALFTARSITHSVSVPVRIAQRIAAGELDQIIDTQHDGEVGELLSTLRQVQEQLRSQQSEKQPSSSNSERIRQALDNVTTNVMITDADLNIVYLNPAVENMLQHAEADLRKDLPGFAANRVLGSNIDLFHKNPAHQRNMLAALRGTHRAQISVGGRTFSLVVTPILGEGGERMGIVVEWGDHTQEARVEQEMRHMLDGIIGGDLTKRIDLHGKSGFSEVLSRSVNQLADNMAEVVSRVKRVSTEVRLGADEITQGTANLSERTEQQSSSLEETASSMDQMTGTVKQNADNAHQASQLAVAARDQAENGGAVVAKAVHAMEGINEASTRIADIIGVIDEIAFQTNLLALNAAVEAARAGEQGRGFAVVASEVRSLAQRSANAAKEIKELIQDTVKKVSDGSVLVTQSGQTLEQIVASVKKVTDIVSEIATASREQSVGIDQVNRAVAKMDEMTQQNAALVEQTTAASQAMAEQARALNEMMDRYQVAAAALEAADAAIEAGGGKASQSFSSVRVERRSASRPWSQPSKAKAQTATPAASGTRATVHSLAAARPTAAPPVRTVIGAAGSSGDEWEEF